MIFIKSLKGRNFSEWIFPILGIQNSIQSDAVLTCSFAVIEGRGPASSGIPMDVKIQEQTSSEKERTNQAQPEGHYMDLPAHVMSLVMIWLSGLTVNKWTHGIETIRWDDKDKINQALQQGTQVNSVTKLEIHWSRCWYWRFKFVLKILNLILESIDTLIHFIIDSVKIYWLNRIVVIEHARNLDNIM